MPRGRALYEAHSKRGSVSQSLEFSVSPGGQRNGDGRAWRTGGRWGRCVRGDLRRRCEQAPRSNVEARRSDNFMIVVIEASVTYTHYTYPRLILS